jgi:hypothetical protein
MGNEHFGEGSGTEPYASEVMARAKELWPGERLLLQARVCELQVLGSGNPVRNRLLQDPSAYIPGNSRHVSPGSHEIDGGACRTRKEVRNSKKEDG